MLDILHGEFGIKSEVVQIGWAHDAEPFECFVTDARDIDVDDVDATSDGDVPVIFEVPLDVCEGICFVEGSDEGTSDAVDADGTDFRESCDFDPVVEFGGLVLLSLIHI